MKKTPVDTWPMNLNLQCVTRSKIVYVRNISNTIGPKKSGDSVIFSSESFTKFCNSSQKVKYLLNFMIKMQFKFKG